jgi:purine-nucleoside phosphorylase
MSTPHNQAEKGEIAKTVLMPGDPLRAKVVADTYLKNVKQFNSVRNMLGYTGEYKGIEVSVMGSGMGIPSIGIYSYELYDQYDVENIIRIGTVGGITKNTKVGDIIIAQGACTNSSYQNQYHLNGHFAPIADYNLLKTSCEESEKLNATYHVGNVLSSDTFYTKDVNDTLKWGQYGVLGVEMEAAALYMNAANLNKKALGIFTISDSLVTHEKMSAEKRQNDLHKMMEISLNTAIKIN